MKILQKLSRNVKVLIVLMAIVYLSIGLMPLLPSNESNRQVFGENNRNLLTLDSTGAVGLIDLTPDASRIVEEMGPGWNLGNTMDAPTETAWSSPFTTQELITSVHDHGFGNIRIPITWSSHTGSAPDYDGSPDWTIHESWLSRVQEIVDYAYNIGMYVVINAHHDASELNGGGSASWITKAAFAYDRNLAPDAQTSPVWLKGREHYKRLWEQIAERFKDYSGRLIFEAHNELGLGQIDWQGFQNPSRLSQNLNANAGINVLNQDFVNAVRGAGSSNEDRWLIMSGLHTSNMAIITQDTEYVRSFQWPIDPYDPTPILDPAKDRSKIRFMQNWHYYPNQNGFAFNGAKSYLTDLELIEHLEERFTIAGEYFSSKGIPVYLGEYGACDKSLDPVNDTARAKYAEAVQLISRRFGIIPVWWDVSEYSNTGFNTDGGFALFDRRMNDNHSKPHKRIIIEAIMRGWYGYEVDTESEVNDNFLRTQIERITGTYYKETEVNPITQINLPRVKNIKEGTRYIIEPECVVESYSVGHEINDNLIWRSHDNTIATVYNGIISAKKPGTVCISAYSLRSARGGELCLEASTYVTVVPSDSTSAIQTENPSFNVTIVAASEISNIKINNETPNNAYMAGGYWLTFNKPLGYFVTVTVNDEKVATSNGKACLDVRDSDLNISITTENDPFFISHREIKPNDPFTHPSSPDYLLLTLAATSGILLVVIIFTLFSFRKSGGDR